jgi:hypothetical protein
VPLLARPAVRIPQGATAGLPRSGNTAAGMPLLHHAAAAELDPAGRKRREPRKSFVRIAAFRLVPACAAPPLIGGTFDEAAANGIGVHVVERGEDRRLSRQIAVVAWALLPESERCHAGTLTYGEPV